MNADNSSVPNLYQFRIDGQHFCQLTFNNIKQDITQFLTQISNSSAIPHYSVHLVNSKQQSRDYTNPRNDRRHFQCSNLFQFTVQYQWTRAYNNDSPACCWARTQFLTQIYNSSSIPHHSVLLVNFKKNNQEMIQVTSNVPNPIQNQWTRAGTTQFLTQILNISAILQHSVLMISKHKYRISFKRNDCRQLQCSKSISIQRAQSLRIQRALRTTSFQHQVLTQDLNSIQGTNINQFCNTSSLSSSGELKKAIQNIIRSKK